MSTLYDDDDNNSFSPSTYEIEERIIPIQHSKKPKGFVFVGSILSGKTSVALKLKNYLKSLNSSYKICVTNSERYLFNLCHYMNNDYLYYKMGVPRIRPDLSSPFETSEEPKAMIPPIINQFDLLYPFLQKNAILAQSILYNTHHYNYTFIDGVGDNNELLYYIKNGFIPIYIKCDIAERRRRFSLLKDSMDHLSFHIHGTTFEHYDTEYDKRIDEVLVKNCLYTFRSEYNENIIDPDVLDKFHRFLTGEKE